jgi:hypothetical protein
MMLAGSGSKYNRYQGDNKNDEIVNGFYILKLIYNIQKNEQYQTGQKA